MSTRRSRRAVVVALTLTITHLALGSTALGTLSYYRSGTLDAAVTYDSVQRSDWYATAINNESISNMNGRVWAYNVITNSYVMQLAFATFAPGQSYGSGYGSQNSVKNYCRKANGGVQWGSCTANY